MSLFKERIYYKPFDYEWAFEAYNLQQKMHWLPSEVPLHEDVRDWNERLTTEEKNLINQILKFFTQGDVDIAQAYLDNYIPKFKPPEIRMMLSSFATAEANHAHAYSLLNDTIGTPELTNYKTFQEYKEMADKHDYLFKDKGKGVEGLSASEIAAHPETTSLFNNELETRMEAFPQYEKIKKFTVIDRLFQLEKDEITPSLKIKRKAISENFKDIIDAMYNSDS